MIWAYAACAATLATGILYLYVRFNDNALGSIPARALAFSPKRWTPDDVSALAKQLRSQQAIDITAQIPPKTGRRYIVVGGVRLALCISFGEYNHL